MKGIVICSHGNLAKGIEDTLSLFFGEIEQAEFLSLASDEEIDPFYERMINACEKVDRGDGVIIFTDMFGGTPNNCAMRLLDRYDVVSGYNLPMLMSVLTERITDSFDLLSIIEECKSSFVYVNKLDSNIEDDDF